MSFNDGLRNSRCLGHTTSGKNNDHSDTCCLPNPPEDVSQYSDHGPTSSHLDVGQMNIMQLSLQRSRQPTLPSYPIADTLAMLLILMNVPNVLVMASHLLFSYKEHVPFNKSTLHGMTPPPLYLILSIDIAVSLFTVMILPSLRSTITDASHILMAVSVSGAKWKASLPLTMGTVIMRGLVNRLSGHNNAQGFDTATTTQCQFLYRKFFSHMIPPLHVLDVASHNLSLRNLTMEYIKSAMAIHIFSVGLFRFCRYWMRTWASNQVAFESDPSQAGSRRPGLKSKNGVHGNSKSDTNCGSVWDVLLQVRAESIGKRYSLKNTATENHMSSLWLSEIAARFVVFGLRTECDESVKLVTEPPSVKVHVNGLLWEPKILASSDECGNASGLQLDPRSRTWRICIDNLSAKTEYDFCLELPTSTPEQHNYMVCTSTEALHEGHIRGDPSILPAITTSSIDDLTLNNDGQIVISGPLSPVTTFEESVSNAGQRLEEKKTMMRRIRKDNSKRLQSLQRDVEHLEFRVHSGADKTEQRAQGRMLSLQTEIKRMQDSLDDLEASKYVLHKQKSMQEVTWTESKQRRDSEARILDEIRQRYNAQKEDHQKRLAPVESEAARNRIKADKLCLRRTKIQQELDRISGEQDDILNKEFRRRTGAREVVRNQRLQTEAEYLKLIHEVQQRSEYVDLYCLN